MSTPEDHTSGASGMAEGQAAGLLGSDVREGYAEIGDVRLHFDLPDLPEAVVHASHRHFFRHFLRDASPAYTPEETDRYIEAWSQPGAATGMINYYRSSVRTPRRRPKRLFARSRRPRWSSGGKAIATSAPS